MAPTPAGVAPPPRLPAPPSGKRGAVFLGEKEFKARQVALLDAIGEQERRRSARLAAEAEWDEEDAREARGEKRTRRGGEVAATAAPSLQAAKAATASATFAEQVEGLWGDDS